jgi:FHS family L-fucose permease-like MFS transporter
MAIVGGAVFPPVLGLIARATGSLAEGYIVPAAGFIGVAVYGFLAEKILPTSGNTSPDAGPMIAGHGSGI